MFFVYLAILWYNKDKNLTFSQGVKMDKRKSILGYFLIFMSGVSWGMGG